MKTFVDPVEFCRHVSDYATAQGWELKLDQVDVPMRYRWQWTWKGMHPLPVHESMFPNREEALFAACMELTTLAQWPMRIERAEPLELVPPTGLGRTAV